MNKAQHYLLRNTPVVGDQARLARETGLSPSTITRILDGALPSLKAAYAFKKAEGLKIEDWFTPTPWEIG